MIKLLRSPLNPEVPDFGLMEELHAAGLTCCPVSGTPVVDVSKCSKSMRIHLWGAWCAVAHSINSGKDHEDAAVCLANLQNQLQAEAAESTGGEAEATKGKRQKL